MSARNQEKEWKKGLKPCPSCGTLVPIARKRCSKEECCFTFTKKMKCLDGIQQMGKTNPTNQRQIMEKRADILHHRHGHDIIILSWHKHGLGDALYCYGTEGAGHAFLGHMNHTPGHELGQVVKNIYSGFMRDYKAQVPSTTAPSTTTATPSLSTTAATPSSSTTAATPSTFTTTATPLLSTTAPSLSTTAATPSLSTTAATPSLSTTAATPSTFTTTATPSTFTTTATPSLSTTAATPSLSTTAATPSLSTTAATPSTFTTTAIPSTFTTAATPSLFSTAVTPSTFTTATTPSPSSEASTAQPLSTTISKVSHPQSRIPGTSYPLSTGITTSLKPSSVGTPSQDMVMYKRDGKFVAAGTLQSNREVLHGHDIPASHVCVYLTTASENAAAPLVLGNKEENSILQKGMFFALPRNSLFKASLVGCNTVSLEKI